MYRTRSSCSKIRTVQPYFGLLFFGFFVFCTCYVYNKVWEDEIFFFLFWKRDDEILVTHWPDPHISLRLTTAWQVLEHTRPIKEVSAFSFHLNWNENSLLKKKRKKELEWNTERRVTSLRLFCFSFELGYFVFVIKTFFFLVKVILFLFLKHQMLTQRLKKKWYSPIGY